MGVRVKCILSNNTFGRRVKKYIEIQSFEMKMIIGR
jgi:hypothetical protein